MSESSKHTHTHKMKEFMIYEPLQFRWDRVGAWIRTISSFRPQNRPSPSFQCSSPLPSSSSPCHRWGVGTLDQEAEGYPNLYMAFLCFLVKEWNREGGEKYDELASGLKTGDRVHWPALLPLAIYPQDFSTFERLRRWFLWVSSCGDSYHLWWSMMVQNLASICQFVSIKRYFRMAFCESVDSLRCIVRVAAMQ